MPEYGEQQYRDSVAAYQALPVGDRPIWTYQGWDADASLRLSKYLAKTLKRHHEAVIHVEQGLTPAGEVTLWHSVWLDGTLLGTFNESHPCPPHCG